MDNRTFKLSTSQVPLKVTPGHFATNHAHVNYYLDSTTLKSRQSEARETARALVGAYVYNTVVDTIVCLEGMQVVGAYLADELTQAGVMSRNAHQTIYVVSPEFNSNSQMIFRDNLQPMIKGKNILLLLAVVTTGKTIAKGMECIQYYGGILQGISAIFTAVDQVDGIPIHSVYTKRELPDYQAFDFRECPFCQKGQKLDALVNSYGYSKL
ncbi:MAG: orotate phosphoribosyltransferase [Monoglobales bacterium]|jgi:orotate phosphoribosyltransferase|uniref:orotate phosphoribosyltransferase n=1 Tax=Candidatus Ventrimonas sp. TaxID=3048889 RepID=UPI003A2C4B53